MLVFTTTSFNKDISKIRDKKIALRIEQAIKNLEQASSVTEITSVKKLAGHTNAYRIRIGDYRLGFFLVNKNAHLTVFAHRKDIYRSFP